MDGFDSLIFSRQFILAAAQSESCVGVRRRLLAQGFGLSSRLTDREADGELRIGDR